MSKHERAGNATDPALPHIFDHICRKKIFTTFTLYPDDEQDIKSVFFLDIIMKSG